MTNEILDQIEEGMKSLYITNTKVCNGETKTDTISFDSLTDMRLITEGVCGGKLPCVSVSLSGEKKILKLMSKGLNYGNDYAYVDEQKELFGLNRLNVVLKKMDKTLKNKDRSYEWVDGESIYAVMDDVDCANDLGKLKTLLKDDEIFREMLKVRLFNGLFRSSDNILRNILVQRDTNRLYAIDENDIFGKRKSIFNKTEPIKKHDKFTRSYVRSVLEEMDIKSVKRQLVDNLSNWNLARHEDALSTRIDEYEAIVMEEISRG